MSDKRIAALGIAVMGVAAALAVVGVDRFETGTARQPTGMGPGLPPQPAAVLTRAEVERSLTEASNMDESARRGLQSDVEASDPVRAAYTRRAGMKTVVALADTPGAYAESALADAALSHMEFAVREEAVHALGERGGAVALQTVQQALQDPSPRVREAAVDALVDMGGDDAVLALGPALSAQDVSTRVNALDALGEIGGPGAARYVEQMLQDESDVVREAAVEWLAELQAQEDQLSDH